MKIRQCDKFSNMLKFYYCYKTNNFNFTVTSMYELHIFQYCYLMCSIFIHSSKFTNVSSFISPNPISGLSYCKPMTKIQPRARAVVELSPYEKRYVEENGLEKLTNTAASIESFKNNMKHVTYTMNQDRDSRIFTGYSTIGGVNQSELIIEQSDEAINEMIKILLQESKN